METLDQLIEVLTALKEGKGDGLYTKTPAQFHTGVVLHGSGGIFQGPGLEREIITAMVRPTSIASVLPLLPTVDENPQYGALTGVTDDIGNEPAHACDDAPTGYIKACTLTARFGMLRRDTKTIEMDQVMRRVNRGDFTDLTLYGRLLGMTDLPPSGLPESQVLNLITAAEMVGTGVRAERELSRQMWQGAWGTNTEFPGLDVQIAPGQVDANT